MLSQTELHRRFLDVLEGTVLWSTNLALKPLDLNLRPPLPGKVRLYLYNITHPQGGRPSSEYKIRLMVRGQRRHDRAGFASESGRFLVLGGYEGELDVFVLWDAGLYSDFAWSRNVQVKAETIIQASAGKLAFQERRLRPRSGRPPPGRLVAHP